MLELAILGLLEDREHHGYEIRKELRDRLGLLANVSFGSLYPALARLERAGAVMTLDAPSPQPAHVPATGSLSGELAVLKSRSLARGRRSKRVYSITEVGKTMFSELLTNAGAKDDARSFGTRLTFARHLTPHSRVSLFERRKVHLQSRLEELEQAEHRSGIDHYACAVIEHTKETVANDIEWLERLIADERDKP